MFEDIGIVTVVGLLLECPANSAALEKDCRFLGNNPARVGFLLRRLEKPYVVHSQTAMNYRGTPNSTRDATTAPMQLVVLLLVNIRLTTSIVPVQSSQ